MYSVMTLRGADAAAPVARLAAGIVRVAWKPSSSSERVGTGLPSMPQNPSFALLVKSSTVLAANTTVIISRNTKKERG